jgi:hypothetical protein
MHAYKRVLSALILLASVAALAACREQTFPDTRPFSAVDVETLTLAPYTDPWLGLRGILPEGWIEAYPGAYPGVYISGPAADRPSTTLLQRLEADQTLEQAKKAWLRREGEAHFPARVSQHETAALHWEIHEHPSKTARGPTPGRGGRRRLPHRAVDARGRVRGTLRSGFPARGRCARARSRPTFPLHGL